MSYTIARGGLTVSNLLLQPTAVGEARIQWGTENPWMMKVEENDSMQKTLKFKRGQKDVMVLDDTVTLIYADKVEVENLEVTKSLHFKGVKQWNLVYSLDLENDLSSWKLNQSQVSSCGPVQMLGGHCIQLNKDSEGRPMMTRSFSNLPAHTKLKISGVVHFLDHWSGDTLYIKIISADGANEQYVYAESHSVSAYDAGIDVCGSNIVDHKFSVPFEVNLASINGFTVEIGSTLSTTDPCIASFGVSSFEVYILT